MGLEVMRGRRRAEQRDGDVSCPLPCLVVHPSLHSRPHMAADALDLLVRGLDPTVVRGADSMAARAEFRMIREWNRRPPKSHCTGNDGTDHNGRRFTRHLASVAGNAA